MGLRYKGTFVPSDRDPNERPTNAMKKLVFPIAMNTILSIMLNAQDPWPMTPTTNWLAAHQQTLGLNAAANWLLDLDDLEVFVTTEHALVLVDRSPMVSDNGVAYLRKGVNGLGGTHLTLIGEVECMSESVMHGTYSGLLGGTAVLMDQYMQLSNGVPAALVRVITRVNGSAPFPIRDHEKLLSGLFNRVIEEGLPALTRN